ncbi:MAG: DUF2336 domain-containing protein [Rhizobium sp.]|nr:DUF2336 domain-containing protein [Rhizobium sp.]
MIIQSFLRWAETAKTSERARAANALGRAWLQSHMTHDEREAALMAMTWLLDDPSPKVRLALAEAIADAEDVPRSLVLPLANDQPHIACQVISRSPVLSDVDLVDLAGRGDSVTRVLIASRFIVSIPVCAAIAEVGDVPEIEAMLDNPGAIVTRGSLRRISERFATDPQVREMLLEREELPCDARHRLAVGISESLGACNLIREVVGERRLERIRREACETATVVLAGSAPAEDLPALVEHLRCAGSLTPAFLMQALCSGRFDFFMASLVNLSGMEDRRVRSIITDGRFHAARALFESAGLDREVSEVFVEAVMLWRKAEGHDYGFFGGIASKLVAGFRSSGRSDEQASALIDMVERLDIAEHRQSARAYASFLALAAA